MNLDIPDRKDFGFGDVVEIQYLQQVFGISRRTACKYLKALRIKPMYIGEKMFFSLVTFKRILFVLSLPGSPGFIFPGSSGRRNTRLLKDPNYMTEVTDEILQRASAPRVLAEMKAAEGRDGSILQKFVAKPVGRPPKESTNE
jgi:hypothetical protein